MKRSGILIIDRWLDTTASTTSRPVLLPSDQRCHKDFRYRARAWDAKAPPRKPGGKRGRYLDQCFPTNREAIEWAQARRKEFTDGVATAVPTTLAQMCTLYLERLEHRLTGKPTERYLQQVKQVSKGLQNLGVTDIRDPALPGLVQRWLCNLQMRRHRQKLPRAASSTQKINFLTICRAIMNHAVNMCFIPFNPLRGIAVGKQVVSRRSVYQVYELRRLLSDAARFPDQATYQAARDAYTHHGDFVLAAAALGVAPSTVHYRINHPPQPDPWWMVAALLIYTGCRLATALALTPRQVDLAREEIVIPGDFPGNKTKFETVVPIQPELLVILTEYLSRPTVNLDEPFVGPHFRTFRSSSLTKGFKDFVRRNGIDPGRRGPHTLRHSFCSLMSAIGVNHFAVMGMVGHQTAQVHLIYAQSATRYSREVTGWPRRPEFFLRRELPGTPALAVVASPVPAPFSASVRVSENDGDSGRDGRVAS